MDNATFWAIVGAIAVPLLSGIGSWVATKVAIAVIQVKVEAVTKRVDEHSGAFKQLNEDSLVHDMELESLLAHAKIPRVRRQRARD
jgi:hypothetical protein